MTERPTLNDTEAMVLGRLEEWTTLPDLVRSLRTQDKYRFTSSAISFAVANLLELELVEKAGSQPTERYRRADRRPA